MISLEESQSESREEQTAKPQSCFLEGPIFTWSSLGASGGEGNTHGEHGHLQAARPFWHARGDRQNRERCDICKTLPLMSLFDESSNAVFTFVSPGNGDHKSRSSSADFKAADLPRCFCQLREGTETVR